MERSPVFIANEHPPITDNKPVTTNSPLFTRSQSQQELKFDPPRKNSNFTFSQEKIQTAFKYQPPVHSNSMDESEIEFAAPVAPIPKKIKPHKKKRSAAEPKRKKRRRGSHFSSLSSEDEEGEDVLTEKPKPSEQNIWLVVEPYNAPDRKSVV